MNPMIRRIVIGKSIGFTIGLIGFFAQPAVWPGATLTFRVGILAWYTTFGAIVGFFGMMDHHPVLKFRMPFWFRGIFFGGWLNLVVTWLAYDQLSALMAGMAEPWNVLQSPYWFAAEGAVIGLVIDAIATRFGGEGMTT